MTISLHPHKRPQQWTPEERYRFLSTILESFAGTLDLKEVLRRIVNITLEQFHADRVLLISPVGEGGGPSNIRYVASAPGIAVGFDETAPLQTNPAVMRRAFDSTRPIVILEGDPDANPELMKRFSVRSAVLQILGPRGDEP